MAQHFSLTRRNGRWGAVWAMPTAAFSNVPRNRSSLSRSALLGLLLAGHVQVQALDEAEGAVRGEHPMAARPDPPDRAVLVPDAVLGLVHPPLPQGGEDGLAGRRPVLGQHDVGVVEPAGSELVGRVAGQVFDALADEQGGPVIVGQGPVGQSRKVPHERVELPLPLPQRLLGPFAVGDVSGGADEANGFSVRVAQHRAGARCQRVEPSLVRTRYSFS